MACIKADPAHMAAPQIAGFLVLNLGVLLLTVALRRSRSLPGWLPIATAVLTIGQFADLPNRILDVEQAAVMRRSSRSPGSSMEPSAAGAPLKADVPPGFAIVTSGPVRRHVRAMRYADSGGLSRMAPAKREALRLEAAEAFEAGEDSKTIAERLRVTRKSVNDWRRAWRAGGAGALRSKCPGGYRCKLDESQLTLLQYELDRGPAEHGWVEDQRWTPARIVTLTRELFGISYTLRGMSYVLHRIGWSPQVPVHQAAERDEGVWAHLKRSIANLAPRGTEELAALIGSRLRHLQYRPHLLDGFITETGLLIEPPRP